MCCRQAVANAASYTFVRVVRPGQGASFKSCAGMRLQGATLAAVGLGEPVQARQFCEIHGFPADKLYSDASGAAYAALRFRYARR